MSTKDLFIFKYAFTAFETSVKFEAPVAKIPTFFFFAISTNHNYEYTQ